MPEYTYRMRRFGAHTSQYFSDCWRQDMRAVELRVSVRITLKDFTGPISLVKTLPQDER